MSRTLQLSVLLLNAFVLALEIGMTRIFSVTMFYHFAFMAIGVALFGFGAAGVLLYISGDKLQRGSLNHVLGRLSILAGITAVVALIIILQINFNPQGSLGKQFTKLLIIYMATTVPFFFAGLALPLLFQRLGDHIAGLYLWSLVGSAIGCVVVVPLLQFAGGPGAIIAISALAIFAGVGFFSADMKSAACENRAECKCRFQIPITLILGVLILAMGFLNPHFNFVKITHAKGYAIDPEMIIFDRWNAFSRIIVLKGKDPMEYYLGGIHMWGISEKWDPSKHPLPDQLWLEIDNTAGTPITKYSGDPSEIEIAKYDVTAAGYYLLKNPSVLVVGPGGGKDLLAGIAFGASKLDGAEINPLIGDVMRKEFPEFNGYLYDRDPVKVTVSEGRTFIARSREKYDLIQISLIDTWAAASTGAYALSENNLYTVEAFLEYFEHLKPDGIYSMSRFEFDPPRETLKVAVIAQEALRRIKVEDISRCFIIIKQGHIANVMVKPAGFDLTEIEKMASVVSDLGYEVLYLPGMPPENAGDNKWFYEEMPRSSNPEEALKKHSGSWYYWELLAGGNPDRFISVYPLDIRPTTDDRPFFFYLLPPTKFLQALKFGRSYSAGYNSIAIFTLVALLLISIFMVLLFMILPLGLYRRKDILERAPVKLRLLGYFTGLGLSFMLIEIALMQHFMLFLGYPVYSLVAVLMSLLLFSGLGAGFSGRIPSGNLENGIAKAIGGIITVTVIYLFILPWLFTTLIVLPDWARIIISVVLVFPLGWFMGQPFPLGLRLIERERLGIIPWAWGVNGAASVLGSSLTLTLAIAMGYNMTLLIGVVVYFLALLIIFVPKSRSKG